MPRVRIFGRKRQSAAGEHAYTEGNLVTLEATPADGWRFDH